ARADFPDSQPVEHCLAIGIGGPVILLLRGCGQSEREYRRPKRPQAHGNPSYVIATMLPRIAGSRNPCQHRRRDVPEGIPCATCSLPPSCSR
ncbi:hypothetical protein GY655_26670, partial [Escherichia coli]|nr:hypothetical protein [Escherichia coli]